MGNSFRDVPSLYPARTRKTLVKASNVCIACYRRFPQQKCGRGVWESDRKTSSLPGYPVSLYFSTIDIDDNVCKILPRSTEPSFGLKSSTSQFLQLAIEDSISSTLSIPDSVPSLPNCIGARVWGGKQERCSSPTGGTDSIPTLPRRPAAGIGEALEQGPARPAVRGVRHGRTGHVRRQDHLNERGRGIGY